MQMVNKDLKKKNKNKNKYLTYIKYRHLQNAAIFMSAVSE